MHGINFSLVCNIKCENKIQKFSFNVTFWSRTWNLSEWIWAIIYCSEWRIFYKNFLCKNKQERQKSKRTYGRYYCILLENTSKIAECCWKFAAVTNVFQESNDVGCINAPELSLQCIMQSVFFGLLGTLGDPHSSSLFSLLIIHV